jgi:hypothetical protein
MNRPQTPVLLADLQAMLDGTYIPPLKPYVDPERVTLFAGLTGVNVSKTMELGPGMIIQPSYAHFFSHFMAAFDLPPNSRAPHPSPWYAVRGGGLMFDVTSQFMLSEGVSAGRLSRLNSIWLVVSLIRLLSGAPIRMPAISTVAFGEVVSSGREPTLWAVETTGIPQDWSVDLDDDFAKGLAFCIPLAAQLMDQPIFNRAYKTFDSVVWLPDPSAQMVAIWTAMETAMRPGRGGTTKRLAWALRSYLGTDRSSGDQLYNEVVRLYGERGNSAHDAQPASAQTVRDSYLIARRMFIQIILGGALPPAAA